MQFLKPHLRASKPKTLFIKLSSNSEVSIKPPYISWRFKIMPFPCVSVHNSAALDAADQEFQAWVSDTKNRIRSELDKRHSEHYGKVRIHAHQAKELVEVDKIETLQDKYYWIQDQLLELGLSPLSRNKVFSVLASEAENLPFDLDQATAGEWMDEFSPELSDLEAEVEEMSRLHAVSLGIPSLLRDQGKNTPELSTIKQEAQTVVSVWAYLRSQSSPDWANELEPFVTGLWESLYNKREIEKCSQGLIAACQKLTSEWVLIRSDVNQAASLIESIRNTLPNRQVSNEPALSLS